MNNKVVISGATGFIGQHLVKRLEKDGMQVYTIPHEKLKNPTFLKSHFSIFQPSIIFHLSSYGNLIHQQDDAEIIQANVNNLFNLLEASRGIEYTNFINFSTSSVTLPVQTMYSATKLAGEAICNVYAHKYGKSITSVRPYTVIGVGEHSEHLIPTLIRSCLTGEKMRFVSEPTHDFIGVNDFIDAISLIIQNYYLKGEVIDIGTGVKTSNREVLNMVEKVTGKKANILPVESMRSYDTDDWVADNIIIKELGWKQKESLEQIITKMVHEIS